MNNKELQVEVTEMLSAGKKKQDVFAVLSGRGVKDRVVAYFIAAHLDPRRCTENKVHRGIIIAIICIQGLLGILAGISIAASDSPTLGLVVGAIVLLITGLFVWGFAKNKASIYNAFILSLDSSDAAADLEFRGGPCFDLTGDGNRRCGYRLRLVCPSTAVPGFCVFGRQEGERPVRFLGLSLQQLAR